jgi:hypothetical protein
MEKVSIQCMDRFLKLKQFRKQKLAEKEPDMEVAWARELSTEKEECCVE